MRLDQALVARSLCESRTEAQELIELGFVTVNGAITRKRIQKIKDEDVIGVTSRRLFVSRGGEKLRGALRDAYGDDEAIQAELSGKIALDIGSSTGGFSDCLLSFGVSHIDAVDVGTEQLHQKLRGDVRVSVFENTDIRAFKGEMPYDVIVADLSFISLESVLDTVLAFGEAKTDFFLLIKPQFEVGKGNTKKGIVKNESLVVDVLRKYEIAAKMKGLHTVTIFPCHLQGGDGNQEFFLYGEK